MKEFSQKLHVYRKNLFCKKPILVPSHRENRFPRRLVPLSKFDYLYIFNVLKIRSAKTAKLGQNQHKPQKSNSRKNWFPNYVINFSHSDLPLIY